MPAPPGMGQSGTTAGGTNAGPGPGSGPDTGGFGYGGSEGRGGNTGQSRGGTFGTYGSRGAGGTRGGRGPANPVAAAAMMSDLGRSVTQTGAPDSPFGEMSPEQQAQIGAMLGRSQDSAVMGGFTDALTGMAGPVGMAMSLANLLGVPSVGDTDSITSAVADNYGRGTLSGLFGSYSDDPGIQAATESYFDGRSAASAAHNAPYRGDASNPADRLPSGASPPAAEESPPPVIYTPEIGGATGGAAFAPLDVQPLAVDDQPPAAGAEPAWLQYLQPYLDLPIDGRSPQEPDWMEYLLPRPRDMRAAA